MLIKIYNFFEGYLCLEVKGDNLEKFINLTMRDGIKLWDIIRISETFYVNIKLKDFKRIKAHLKSSGSTARIKKRRGVPFLNAKIIKRRALLFGVLLMVSLLYLLSSFIFFVEVKGNLNLPKEDIVELLHKAQVRPMVLKSSISIEKLEKAIVYNIPELAWVDLRYKGTKLIVEVIEKKLIQVETGPSDIVAAKGGIISKLIVLKGSPVVSEGMTVSEGDILISKEAIVKREGSLNGEELEGEDRFVKEEVKAEGIVRAKSWYKGYGEAKFSNSYRQMTGNQKVVTTIKFMGKYFHLKGPKEAPYDIFEIKEEVKIFGEGRNINLPIEVIRKRYIQVRKVEEEIDKGIAKIVAKEKAVKGILQGLSKEAIILNSRLELIEGQSDGLIRVKVLLEVEEDISVRSGK